MKQQIEQITEQQRNKAYNLVKRAGVAFVLSIVLSISGIANTNTVTPTVIEYADTLPGKHLFLDVHNLEPGKVKFDAVAGAHKKDLATESKYGVNFIKFWVDEKAGKVYCLAEAPDSASIYKTHKEAHGLVPDRVLEVSDGPEAKEKHNRNLYLDVHKMGPGKVTAEAVAGAHQKDLAVQKKYGVNLINYWVDVKSGTIMCLAEAKDSMALINTHKEAHGLLPVEVHKVKQGN